MDFRSACLATAEIFRQQAAKEPERREFLLAEADKWTQRAAIRLRLAIRIESDSLTPRSDSVPGPTSQRSGIALDSGWPGNSAGSPDRDKALLPA